MGADLAAVGKVNVLLLAGSRGGADDPVAVAAGVAHKALAPVTGQPMIAHVLETLRNVPEIGRIVLLCDQPAVMRAVPAVAAAAAAGQLAFAPAAASPARSVLAGLDRPEAVLPVLVMTADAPLLTPAALHAFLAEVPATADIAAAVASGDAVRRRFPGSRRTFLRFRDGDVSGCNLFLIQTPQGRRAVEFWQRLEAHRKRPLVMAALLGPAVVLGYGLRCLTQAGAMRHLSRRTGANAALVTIPFPEAAVDVDKPADLVLAEAVLAERAVRSGGPPVTAQPTAE